MATLLLTAQGTLDDLCQFLAGDVNALGEKIDLPPVRDWHAWLRYPKRSIGAWLCWFASLEPGWPSDLVAVGFFIADESEGRFIAAP